MKKNYVIKSVDVDVKKAISKYCKTKGITQAYYLSMDKRLKSLLNKD